ncbi:O-antigen ligase family protein [Paucibacter sp. DJ1R-11]|uniref:O-antigen ligase family protein n=1 Tax=Paucibacter sp. DJ1R-11 TaxID=2893556 RepID=UPI0021E3BAE9|nr:O-antigen ligase family protein [Paucibacter sp. DJ1R-11]MCV2365065.1 O-antigen ligase family protein [Paucibacter sp. DJ1R-11]
MSIVVFFGTYILMAFTMAIGFVFIIGGTMHFGVKRPDGFLPYLFVPMVLAIAVATIASARNLGLEELVPEAAELAAGGRAAKWMQRITSIFLLVASLERIAQFILAKRQPSTPRALMLTYAAFWLCSVALPAGLGTRPTVSHEFIYALIIGTGALLTTENGARRTIIWARNALFAFMALGLLFLVVKKNLVLAPYVGGLIPGFNVRFYGLSSGPNAMGPLAVLGLICLWCMPFQRKSVQSLAWLVGVVTLVLTQSRTSWIAAVLCLLILLYYHFRGRFSEGLARGRYKLQSQFLLGLLGLLVVGVMVVLVSGVLGARIDKFLASRTGGDLVTLTGRTEIWAVAIDEWQRSPLFGYGPAMWDAYHRFQIGYSAAFHAHNQFLNVLAASGLIGLLSFLVYLVALVARALPRLAAFKGMPAALGALLLVRSISEVPISLHTFGSESLFHVLLLMLVAGAPATVRLRKPVQARAWADTEQHGSVRGA